MQRKPVIMSMLSSDWWKSQNESTNTWWKKMNESCFQKHKKKSFVLKLWLENSILLIFLTRGYKMSLEQTCSLVKADEG